MDNSRYRSTDPEPKRVVRYNTKSVTNRGVENPLNFMGDNQDKHYQKMEISYESSTVTTCSKSAKKERDRANGLAGDRSSIALLILLYVLQGIPLGIAGSIPYLLSSRHVSYKDQAVFSFVHWPFSIKLLWAPIVDSIYFPAFGRRKSWLVPTQYLLGIFMFILSQTDAVAALMSQSTAASVNVTLLTAMFFSLNFLAATQDIAVDGWALTMLSKRNVGWVATCNSVGQTAGFFAGNVIFLTLESAEFCNKYIRSEPESGGLVTLRGYLQFWSLTFIVVTTLVMILKHERTSACVSSGTVVLMDGCNHSSMSKGDGSESVPDIQGSKSQSVVDAYRQLWRVVRLPAVQSLIIMLLTIKIGFAAADSVTSLKLIEEGVPKENLAMLAIPMIAIDIALPVFITRSTSSQRPLDVALASMPFRLLLGILFAVIVWWVPGTKSEAGEYPVYMYGILLISSALHQVAVYFMFVPLMAFFAKVSDPAIGGTYMTLLNTVCNFGGNWPATVALWLVESLTWTGCVNKAAGCSASSEDCINPSKVCTLVDGYYVESVVCFIIGFVWLIVRSKKVRQLQDLSPSDWTR